MYESFFQLRTLPFKITPDDRVFFGGGQRSDMLQALIYAVERGEGLITVVGEVGAGKTTLARVLSGRLPEGVRLVSIFTPNVSANDMLYLICQELGLEVVPLLPKYVLIERLREYLFQEQAQGRRVLLLIDEAQAMPLETLEELRLLSNLETNDFKLLQMMLFGQPELEATLALPQVRQVRDRIVYQIRMQPFALQELGEYLAFRLEQAGYVGPVLFTDDVVLAIWEKTHGFPRAVNKLADHVLMAAYARGSHTVTTEDVDKVSSIRGNIQYRTVPETGWLEMLRRPVVAASAVAVVGMTLLGTGIVWLMQDDAPEVHEQPQVSSPSGLVDAPAQGKAATPPVAAERADAGGSVTTAAVPAPAVVAQEKKPAAVSPAVSATPGAQLAAVQPHPVSDAQTTSDVPAQALSAPVVQGQKPVAVSRQDASPGSVEPTAPPKAEKTNVTKQAANAAPARMAWPLGGDWTVHRQQTLAAIDQAVAKGEYSLQLMSDPWRVRDDFVARAQLRLRGLPEREALLIDYVLADGRSRIALLYGVYDNIHRAQDALKSLPDALQRYAPVVVSLKRVEQQMRQSDASAQEL